MSDASEILSAGLSAMRTRINVIASNLANAQTTRTPEGGPYKRRDVVIAAKRGDFEGDLDSALLAKPVVQAVVKDNSPPQKVYQPGHPDADKNGYVLYPNINIVATMTDLMSATRLYQANVSAMKTQSEMARDARAIATVF